MSKCLAVSAGEMSDQLALKATGPHPSLPPSPRWGKVSSPLSAVRWLSSERLEQAQQQRTRGELVQDGGRGSGARKGVEAHGRWQVKGETAERVKCWKGNGLHDPLGTIPTAYTHSHTLIFLRGQSMCFYGHRVLLLTRGPLKNTAVSFPGQKFNTLPIESFPWVFTVRGRKRRLPSKLFSLSIVLLQRLCVKIRKALRKGWRKNWKGWGQGAPREKPEGSRRQVHPVSLPFHTASLQPRARPNQQQNEEGRAQSRADKPQVNSGVKDYPQLGTQPARQLLVKQYSSMSRLRSEYEMAPTNGFKLVSLALKSGLPKSIHL